MPLLNPKVSESLTLALLGRVREMRAQGLDVCSLAAGEPDFPTPDFVEDAAIKSMRAGNTKYVASQGIAELREGIAKDYRDRLGAKWVTADHVVVTGGAKQGIHVALSGVLSLGDEVLVPRPYWVSYPSLVKASGGVVRDFETLEKDKFFPTPQQLEAHYNDRVKAVIFSSPNNPTGKMIDRAALEALIKWCSSRKVMLIYDEIYERLTLGNQPHLCPLALVNDYGEDIICVNAFSKSLAMTGWRLGYVVSHKQTIQALTALQTQFITCMPGFIQKAAADSMDKMENFLKPVITLYRQRMQLMMDGLRKIPGVHFIEPEGAFYVMADFSKIIAAKGFKSDREFCEALVQKERVVIIPGASMGMPGWARLSFATADTEITEGIKRLARFCA
ncbi:MAG: pyridoxal phosphate-dependent aminotransferase [Bdellovibrionales bacterium]|nr:pyridoxal phosphate-dependent aminotransferase [Bdellovibrionales bacterium]